MAWPTAKIAGAPIYNTDINEIINGLSTWAGQVNAAGQALYNVGSATILDSFHLVSAPTRYYSTNVETTPGWAEFTVDVLPGAAAAQDLWVLQYNKRATAGAADDWNAALSLGIGGTITVYSPETSFLAHVSFRGNHSTYPGVLHEWLGGANLPYAVVGQIANPTSFGIWTDAINTPSTSRTGGLTLRAKWMIQPLCAETFGPDFALLLNNDMLAYVNSANNLLVFAVRTTNGVLKLATVPLN